MHIFIQFLFIDNTEKQYPKENQIGFQEIKEETLAIKKMNINRDNK